MQSVCHDPAALGRGQQIEVPVTVVALEDEKAVAAKPQPSKPSPGAAPNALGLHEGTGSRITMTSTATCSIGLPELSASCTVGRKSTPITTDAMTAQ